MAPAAHVMHALERPRANEFMKFKAEVNRLKRGT
jgi:hypothetical protein